MKLYIYVGSKIQVIPRIYRRDVFFVLPYDSDVIVPFRVFLGERTPRIFYRRFPAVLYFLPGNERGLKLREHARGTACVTDMPEVLRWWDDDCVHGTLSMKDTVEEEEGGEKHFVINTPFSIGLSSFLYLCRNWDNRLVFSRHFISVDLNNSRIDVQMNFIISKNIFISASSYRFFTFFTFLSLSLSSFFLSSLFFLTFDFRLPHVFSFAPMRFRRIEFQKNGR